MKKINEYLFKSDAQRRDVLDYVKKPRIPIWIAWRPLRFGIRARSLCMGLYTNYNTILSYLEKVRRIKKAWSDYPTGKPVVQTLRVKTGGQFYDGRVYNKRLVVLPCEKPGRGAVMLRLSPDIIDKACKEGLVWFDGKLFPPNECGDS